MASPPSPRTIGILVLAVLLGSCGGDSTAPDPTVASVDITGTPAAPIAVGASVQLTATPRNAHGDRLGGHTITWLSGDPLIASVSDSGKVTALDGGSALIVASVDGKSARTTILVSPMGVSSLSVTPATPRLYVNATKQLHADVKDARGRVLSGHTVTWQTSDASKATVDGTGVVRGVSAGQVTITAASDGILGTAIVTVIPPAVTDWSGAADWTTFQGDASHDGYVPVTIDPNAINPRWTVDFHAALQPVATGDGKVFVTASDRRLTVLDEHTGAQKWVYAFGPVDNVNPPAYGDGGVFAQTGGQYANSYFWGFDASTGAMRFRTHYSSQWQTYFAPVIAGQSMISGGGEFGGVYALSSASGAQRWFASIDFNDAFSPAVRDGLVYVYTGTQTRRLAVFDAATGSLSWQIADTGTGQPNYGLNGAPALGTLNDAIVTQGGRVVAFDLANRRVKWQVPGSFTGVAVASGVVYASDAARVFALDEATGARLWSWTSVAGALGQPVVTNNVLFVSNGASLFAIDLSTHATVWQAPGSGNIAISRDGILLLSQGSGQLVAWDLK